MKRFLLDPRRILSLIVAVAGLLLFMTYTATAAETQKASKDEMKLNAEITMLNHDAKLPLAEKIVKNRLTKEFDVKSDMITSLRDKKLEYGEIVAIFAIADKMDGGITEANINRVATMRQGKTPWGQIAQSLKVDVGNVASKISSFEEDAHKEIKQAMTEAPASGRGAGGGELESDSGAGGTTGGATGRPDDTSTGGAGEPGSGKY